MSDQPKASHVGFAPDPFIAGVAGKLTMEEVGLYWMICSLIYSHGGPIDDDAIWLSRFFAGTSARRVRRVLDALVEHGKVSREFGDSLGQKVTKLSANRTQTELKLAANRIQTARKLGQFGGRPLSKINDLSGLTNFAGGFGPRNLGPKPTLSKVNRESSSPSESVAARPKEENEKQPAVVGSATLPATPSSNDDPPNLPAAPPEQPLEVTGALLASPIVRRKAS